MRSPEPTARSALSSPSRINLFPWRTLSDNVALSLELAGVGRAERRREVARWIKRVGLEGVREHACPYQLSGGMRQRANIIRTLIYEPPDILMDEPFGPLDAQTRLSLQALLLSIWESQHARRCCSSPTISPKRSRSPTCASC